MKKKITLLKVFMTLCLLLVGIANAWGETKTLTFDLSKNPGSWPATNSETLTDYTYTLDGVDYTFGLENVKCNSGYLMLTSTAVLGLPAIEDYKLTKVVAKNSSNCSTSTKVGVSSSSSSASYITGGAIQTWSTQSSSYTYDLSSTEDNTVYYLYVTNKNAQVTELTLTYESGSTPSDKPYLSVSPKTIDFGTVYQNADVEGKEVTVTFANLTTNDVEANTNDLKTFNIDKYSPFASGDKITITPVTYGLGNYEETLKIFSETDNLEETVTVTMNVVEAPAPTGTFAKFTGDLVEGDYVITSQKSGETKAAMKAELTTSSTKRMVGVDIAGILSDDKITNPDVSTIWHIAPDASNDGYWNIYNEDAGVYAAFTSTNGAAALLQPSNLSDYGRWQMDDNKEFTNKGKADKYLRYNKDVSAFASYATTTGATLTLYQKVLPSPTSISVKTAPTKVTYNVGETFDPTGLKITANYDGGDPKEIAYADNESKFSFEPNLETALTTANNKVTITYGGKSVDQTITVNLNILATPTGLQAQNVASTSATLTWDAVANASSYEVTLNGETKAAETNSLSVENLTASTTYTWTVKAIGDNTTYADSDASEESSFTTLAPPTVAYTVTFNGNNHGTPASESITETEAGAGVTLPDVTPDVGYQFVGWATTSTATEADAGEAGATYYPTDNITLYAVYNVVYTINYMVNGVNTDAQENVVKGTALVFPEVTAPDADHVFCGWVTSAIEGTQATAPEYVNTTGLTASENITYYAVFAEKEGGVSGKKAFDYSDFTKSGEGWTCTKDPITVTQAKGGIPTSSSYVTLTEGNLLKITCKKGYKINAIDFTTSEADYTGNLNDVSDLSTTEWELSVDNPGAKTTCRLKSVEVTYSTDVTYSNYCTTFVTKVLESISLSGNYPTVFWKGETFSHEGMTVTAHYENAEDEDVTEKAEFTGYDMASAGEQEVTVTYDTKEAKYNITVKTIANTKETAYTVEKAKELIDAGNDLGTEVYVKGTVSNISTVWSSQYGNISFDVSEDGATTGQQFRFYHNYKGANKTQWASAEECPAVGDFVIGYGSLTYYNTGKVYEFEEGNYLVNYTSAPMSITSAKLSTFIAPFPVTIPEGVQAYTATAGTDAIVYTEVESVIPACTPVVLYNDVTETYSKTCKGSSLATENSYKEGSLVGTLVDLENVPTLVEGAPTYLLQNNGGKVGFYKTNSEKTYTLKANRAYLVGVNSVNAKDFFDFDGITPTGINEINVSKFPAEGIYDLNGRKLAVPQKGINIINGVKVIVK